MKTLDDHKREIAALIEKLIAARAEYNRLVSDEEEEEQLGQPATPEEIAALEKRLGKPLPPSYRAFLELHNGWTNFSGPGKLLAVEDHGSAWLESRIRRFRNLFLDVEEDQDVEAGEEPFKAGMLPVMMGEDIRHYVMLDPRTARDDGEMTLFHYDLVGLEDSYDDFACYLRRKLSTEARLVEKKKLREEDEEN